MPPKFELKKVKHIEAVLKALPPVQKLSKAEALDELAGTIRLLEERGYEAQQIADHLTAQGLPVSARTVRKVLTGQAENSLETSPETAKEETGKEETSVGGESRDGPEARAETDKRGKRK